MAKTRSAKRPAGLAAIVRTIPLLAPAVSALAPAQVALAAMPRDASLQELAQAVARGDDAITPERLRDLIVAHRGDYTLIDIRSPQEFAQGHIQGAQNVPLPKLFDPSEIVRLRRVPQVIVYADTTDREAQATTLLRVAGVPALGLAGGLEAWAHKITAWSADRRSYEIVRALNTCPQAAPATMPALEAAVPAASQPAAAAPSSAATPAGGTKPPARVNLNGMCN